MNKALALLLLFGAKIHATIVEYDSIADPRCRDEPSRPVLEPKDSPEPMPPTNDRIVVPKCEGVVTGFQIWDQQTGASVMDLEYGSVIKLSDMPSEFTVVAVAPGASKVKLLLNDVEKRVSSSAPHKLDDGVLKEFYVKGTYKLSAQAEVDGVWEPVDDMCEIPVEVIYNNPTTCQGLIQQFSLYDVDAEEFVPGFEILADGQTLQLASLPEELTVIARANGRGSGVAYFKFQGEEFDYQVENGGPYSISGKANGKPKIWPVIRETGTYTIEAKLRDKLENPEPDDLSCKITLNVISHWECPNYVSSFTVIDANTDKPVPGFESISGNHAIDLDTTSGYITVVANGPADRVRFYMDGEYKREDGSWPFSLNGDNNQKFGHTVADYRATWSLSDPGTYTIEARGKKHGVYEPMEGMCGLTLTTVSTDPPSPPTYTTVGGDGCTPAHVDSQQVGTIEFESPPIEIVDRITNETVFFKTKNTIVSQTLGWITTSFVSNSGVEVCDKVEDVTYGEMSEEIYEVKCFAGFAYADIYAYSSDFEDEHASADTTLLPLACKNDVEGKVVKYTFVFTCDCDNVPDVPDEVKGNEERAPPVCAGVNANTWGDPHVVSWTGQKWDCQEEGEFIVAKAALQDYDYDFELRSRYSKFGHPDLSWSFNSGMVAKQDVTVQLSFGEAPMPYSNMFNGLPVNFYVDGQPRFFHEGSGDHRVIVSRDSYNIHIYFTTTGISVRVLIRPIAASGHITDKIPGSMSTFLCLPEDNDAITDVMGLMGTLEEAFVDATGATVSKPQSSTAKDNFCVEHWCVDQEVDSIFTFEEGYDFDFYNGCAPARRQLRRQLTDEEFVWSEEYADVWEICGRVFNDTQCLTDGYAMGVAGAELAAESIWLAHEIELANLLAGTQDEAACCSSDFKTCIDLDECPHAKNKNLCGSCVTDNTWKWMEAGAWTYDDDEEGAEFGGCAARGSSCGESSGSECCPDMTCENSVCVAQPNDVARRLGMDNPGFERKDLGESRKIVALHSEL